MIEKYNIPKEYIKSVITGYNNSFIFLGRAGIGKTFLTTDLLKKQKADYVVSRGVSSPLALYHFLYENNNENKILVFDDVAGLINNVNAYSILLGVLWEGVANWNSTTDKLKVPTKFNFKGRIIIIANRLEGENSNIIKSRCLYYNLKLNNKDVIDIMEKIAELKHSQLSLEERKDIVKFIKNNFNSDYIDLRTQYKIEQLFLYDRKKWKELSHPLLKEIGLEDILMDCIDKNSKIIDAEKEFISRTGKSRKTFYNLKKKYLGK